MRLGDLTLDQGTRAGTGQGETEAGILRGPQKIENIRFNVEEINIIPVRAFKYLGKTLRNSSVPHINEAERKAGNSAAEHRRSQEWEA